MSEIKRLLEVEASTAVPSDGWVEGVLHRVRRRRRVRRLTTSVLALGLAMAGFLIAARAFTPSLAPRPASQGVSNYHMSAWLLEPGTDVGIEPVRGPDYVWIGVEVRWDAASPPGVHQCTWNVFDDSEATVSVRTNLFLPHVPISRGEESYHLKMLGLTGEPASVSAGCDPERLDTPGITALQPPPETSDWEATLAELDARVEMWADRFRIQQT